MKIVVTDKEELINILDNLSFAIITGASNDCNEKENVLNQISLAVDVSNLGYNYTNIIGIWNGKKEPSLIVYGISEAEASKLAFKYKQYAHMHCTGGVNKDISTGYVKTYVPLPVGRGYELNGDWDDNYAMIRLANKEVIKFRINYGN